MTWTLSPALVKLREEVNAKWPKRRKDSDGTIGDTGHAARDSDHNPDASGVVRAFDITHDPATGPDTYAFAEWLRTSRDLRISYVISNGRIFSSTTAPWQWRKYNGVNKHEHHMHVSVVKGANADGWDVDKFADIKTETQYALPLLPTLRLGSAGPNVMLLQNKLNALKLTVVTDSKFGPATRSAVIKFQEHSGLVADGIVGPATWKVLG